MLKQKGRHLSLWEGMPAYATTRPHTAHTLGENASSRPPIQIESGTCLTLYCIGPQPRVILSIPSSLPIQARSQILSQCEHDDPLASLGADVCVQTQHLTAGLFLNNGLQQQARSL